MIDDPITAATLKCKSAKSDACKRYWARQAVDFRIARGDFDMLANIDSTMREALALAMLRELSK